MKKLALPGILALLVVAGIASAQTYLTPTDIKFREGGVQRFNPYFFDPRIVYRKLDTFVYLRPIEPITFSRGYPPFFPRGTARVESVRDKFFPEGQVQVKVKDLKPSWVGNSYYKAFLVDDDSGYWLNLGTFEALGGGTGVLEYRGQHYFDEYDRVVISEVQYFDSVERGTPILAGLIKQRDYYEPPQPAYYRQFGRGVEHN